MPAIHGDLLAAVMATDRDIPANITPRQVTLRDRVTVATLVPISSADDVPPSLMRYLSDQLNKEIAKGDTYAMVDPIPLEQFATYWFFNFGAIMLLGDIKSVYEMKAMERAGADWTKTCLGSFNIRPNYPGRSSHVCNGMFLVTDAARNRGVGRLMGEGYLEWAPKLGYTYAVFNLVYESNVASCRIWDALGFKRIGKVPNAGKVLSSPGEYVDAIIYGRDLSSEGDDSFTQDRFDKIRYYLKHSKYPRGADRAEKSRLRSAATHYKLIEGKDGDSDKLMLKDKEVVSDPQQQYEIARTIHLKQHAGINKTTAAIAVKYHWVRIKETVSRVIRDCPQCKETLKLPPSNGMLIHDGAVSMEKLSVHENETSLSTPSTVETTQLMDNTSLDPHQNHNPFAQTHPQVIQGAVDSITDYTTMPLDPQIIDINQQLSRFHSHDGLGHHPHDGLGHHSHDGMPDPYTHGHHSLSHSNFEDAVRHHTAHDYHMMVEDASDTDAAVVLRQEALGLVPPQVHEVHHDHDLLSKYEYVGQPDDELDFS
ncbi:putative histone acetyltransferase Spt10 [Aspergillus novofumigatus IBT 16806]|uniref:Putative histone acetyltransferase Spt10 n=1 Tax=Aspergillus novofumigatus (strain IBT 16806) TaxID=1392255 RepID=A0A2I1CAG1_ASPN1|nr:putative histone acetyltransferase Spt10 [Aspergillus novofumigatus IBT 16806]PKX94602.1 putative histone acetyltransferase Spt10 [Aspergillus novofumigatus IBT 16806]